MQELIDLDLEQHTDPEQPDKRQIFRHMKRMILLVGVLILIIGFILVWKVYTVETIKISGNELHDTPTVEKARLDDQFSWNSL